MKRPDLELIEEQFRTFERTTASLSRGMANYIYQLESEKLEAYKAIVREPILMDEGGDEICAHCSDWWNTGLHSEDCIVNKATKYLGDRSERD